MRTCQLSRAHTSPGPARQLTRASDLHLRAGAPVNRRSPDSRPRAVARQRMGLSSKGPLLCAAPQCAPRRIILRDAGICGPRRSEHERLLAHSCVSCSPHGSAAPARLTRLCRTTVESWLVLARGRPITPAWQPRGAARRRWVRPRAPLRNPARDRAFPTQPSAPAAGRNGGEASSALWGPDRAVKQCRGAGRRAGGLQPPSFKVGTPWEGGGRPRPAGGEPLMAHRRPAAAPALTPPRPPPRRT